ncbi:hypothetical protein CONLIGDRAFT_645224 [Coniochaeta ligniaria NRRL 30616]|uniref:UDP-N-acetylglucosamine transferase subunit ALG13 n=1 Tax=Coniochaeta ligniaria NRRL 30616 TaxID=1408157 RepID=A0A1J7INY8_9PEZI|nr:hypothetical protein CONLIGDRAFT_645224 [Coniochaeta ligniaria NRRL 30616]
MPAARLPRRCFVTTGSIASFRPLLEEVLSLRFLQALVDHGFDALEVQCGPDLAWFEAQLAHRRSPPPLRIEAMSWAEDIRENMLECRGEAGVRHAGVVIGHAGSGTIMEALRYECPLIIVPNPTLLDNHQTEIASEMAAQDLAVVGTLGRLHEALHISRVQTAKRNLDPPPAPYREPPFPIPETDRRTLIDWTLLTCYPGELTRIAQEKDLPRMSHGSMDTGVDSLDAYDRELALDALRSG